MIKNLLWSLFGKKYLLGGAVEIYRLLTGYKTQITAVLLVLVYAAKVLGYLPADLADQLILLLSGAGGVTLAQKLKRWDEDFKLTERAAELKAEAIKKLAEDGVTPPAPAAPAGPQVAAIVNKDEGLRG